MKRYKGVFIPKFEHQKIMHDIVDETVESLESRIKSLFKDLPKFTDEELLKKFFK